MRQVVTAPRDREGQREVACAEDGDGAHGDLAGAKIGAGQGLAIGQGRVEGETEERASANDLSEQAELSAGAPTLAFKAWAGQAGLGHDAQNEFLAEGLDVGGNGFQEEGAGFEWGGTVGIEGGGGQDAGLVDVQGGSAGEGWIEVLAGGRVDGQGGGVVAEDGGGADEHCAGDRHC